MIKSNYTFRFQETVSLFDVMGVTTIVIRCLISLNSLDLSIINLTKEIPQSFLDLKNIELINLFQHKLESPVPEFVGDFPNHEVLYVWVNNFTFE